MSKILIVENDDRRRQRFCEVLEDEGHHVVGARTCEEAMGCLASCDPPDAVILAMGMRDADGQDVFDCIRRRNPFVPIILSGHCPDAAADSLRAAWVFDATDLDEIKQAVGAALKDKAREAYC